MSEDRHRKGDEVDTTDRRQSQLGGTNRSRTIRAWQKDSVLMYGAIQRDRCGQAGVELGAKVCKAGDEGRGWAGYEQGDRGECTSSGYMTIWETQDNGFKLGKMRATEGMPGSIGTQPGGAHISKWLGTETGVSASGRCSIPPDGGSRTRGSWEEGQMGERAQEMQCS
jgi:hypothetical protein